MAIRSSARLHVQDALEHFHHGWRGLNRSGAKPMKETASGGI
jgi:hypothetical protein